MTRNLRFRLTALALTAVTTLTACGPSDKTAQAPAASSATPLAAVAPPRPAASSATTPDEVALTQVIAPASAPLKRLPQERLAVAANAVKLPTAVTLPAPEAMPRLSDYCNRNLTFSQPELTDAWQRLMDDARQKSRGSNRNKMPMVVTFLHRVREGREAEAEAALESMENQITNRAFLEAYRTAFTSGGNAEDVLIALSNAAPTLSAEAVVEALLVVAAYLDNKPGKIGWPALAGTYACTVNAGGDSRYFSKTVASWPITTHVAHRSKLISWDRPSSQLAALPLEQLLIIAAVEARQAIDKPSDSAPITKGEFEPTTQYQARVAKVKKFQDDIAAEEIAQFLRRFEEALVQRTRWTLGSLAYDADKQEFSGKVIVENSTTEIPVSFPTALDQAQSVKRDFDSAEVKPAFAMDGEGNIALISVQILGGNMHASKSTEKSFPLGLSGSRGQLVEAEVIVDAWKAQQKAELGAKADREKVEQEKIASHPQVQECLADVQRQYGVTSGGAAGIDIQTIQSQAAAIQRCHARARTAAATGGSVPGTLVAAGAFMCSEQRDAMQAAFVERNVPNAPLPAGCQYAGADIEVKMLRTISTGQGELALVGNRGGTVWVDSSRLK